MKVGIYLSRYGDKVVKYLRNIIIGLFISTVPAFAMADNAVDASKAADAIKKADELSAQKTPDNPNKAPPKQPALSEEDLARLKLQMDKNPKNMDAYFGYAKMAMQLGKVS